MALFDWFTKKNKKDATEETEANLEKVTDLQNEDETEQEEPLETETEQYSSEETQQEEISQELESAEEETTEFVEEDVQEDVQEDVPSQEDFDNAEEEVVAETETEPAEEKKLSFFEKIKAGLQKTRSNIMSGIEGVFKSFTKIDDEFYEELEEVLIMADVGTVTSSYIIEELKERVKSKKLHDLEEVRKELIKVIEEILIDENEAAELPTPTVILVIGVNGVGKTTTIGKLTARYQSEGKSVMLAAADTFRAAAIDQLQVWADRNKVQLIKHQENSDPGAVVFDAVKAAKSRNTDILICDTAGRLHNKKNLMDELRKISKIISKEYSEANIETYLVLDATTGQNALQQAKLFGEVAELTGLVLTKLDGTAKGGIVIAIKHEMNIPVKYIGVGEGIEDLQTFNSADFSAALFSSDN